MKTLSGDDCCGRDKPIITSIQGIGSPICTNVLATDGPCPIDACCNFFKLLDEGGGQSFIFSAGGPFQLAPTVDCTNCPPTPTDLFFVSPPTVPDAVEPGLLGALVCLPAGSLPPGTYNAIFRATVSGLGEGGQVVFKLFPDCTAAPCIVVVRDGRGCAAIAANEQIVNEVTTVSGTLAFDIVDSCAPGFIVAGNAGCSGGEPVASAVISNIQIEFIKKSNRLLTSCGNNPLRNDCPATT